MSVRKIRIVTNKPVHRGHTSGQRSLAYVNAGAQYMRQMSGLLKDKVNSLRLNAINDSSQGMFPFDWYISEHWVRQKMLISLTGMEHEYESW